MSSEATEVPTVRIRLHDEWLHAERVLRAHAARQGVLLQTSEEEGRAAGSSAAQSRETCELARGSPVASLLVPVAMRERSLSFKLLAHEKQSKDHEVAVLELEKEVSVSELG